MIEGKKILIIDDDAQIGVTLGKLLAERGAKVRTAVTYEEGIAALKEEMPDLTIVDVLLPGHSGLALVKEVQGWPEPHPLFLVLTNSINAVHIAEAMGANITMFVQKADHDPQEIVDMVVRNFESSAS